MTNGSATMKKISSRSTAFLKKIFPAIWFGILALVTTMGVVTGALKHDPGFLVVPGVMTVVGYIVMRNLVWDLVDEVHDGGEFLVIKNRGEEDRVALSEIMNISSSVAVNPPRITLRLTRTCRFGSEIVFSPLKNFSLNPFAKNQVAEDLMVRIDRARRRAP